MDMLEDSTIARKYLDMAADLAELGRGRTNPNPMVGAVILNDGRIVGKGHHERAGLDHAEIKALREAGRRAVGATLYCTLEPCCHHGRTPPCVDAIIEAKISKVIIGALDPNPKVLGEGINRLKQAGIDVDVKGLKKFEVQNEVYFKYIKTNKPFVTLKLAISLDGKITAGRGSRTMLSGSKAQLEVHNMRNEYQALMVGVGTIIADNPLLSCRLQGERIRQPIRIVVDTAGRMPLDSQIVSTAGVSPVVLATTERISRDTVGKMGELGVEVLICGENGQGKVDLDDLLEKLGRRELTSLIIEGGKELNEELFAKDLIDKLVIFLSPVVISGKSSVQMVATEEVLWKEFEILNSRAVGEDLMIEMYPKKKTGGH